MSEPEAARRRKIQYRCWHRGMRETDILLGKFADAKIDTLSTADLDDLEKLMDALDRDLVMWLTGEVPVPAELDTPVYRAIRAFHTHSGPINL